MSDVRKALGLQIKLARIAKGWKQKHLAAALEVEPVTISRWETGANGPPLARLGEIADALDVTASELLMDGTKAGV